MTVEQMSTIWPEWDIVEQLGEGSFGKVYKIVREEHGVTSNAAMKVISIPQNDAELSSIRSEGLDEDGTRSYFEGIVTDFVNEIKMMESMKGTSNIVSVEDYKVVEKTDKIGWDIYIRMELLTPLNDYIADKPLTEAEVMKLGQDVCSALELCAQRNIIHRDIKPENLFVSGFGDFKVGDFGIARELEKTSGSLSQKGTYNYMAPEITTTKHYDATVDIYSLGLVLYKLLNNNRLPFLDPTAQQIQYQDRKDAIDRRFSGEALPKPANASPDLAKVILKACAFSPAQRFKTPTALKDALEAVKGGNSSLVSELAVTDSDATVAEDKARDADATIADIDGTTGLRRKPQPEQQEIDGTFGTKKKSGAKKILVSVVALICVAGIGAGVYFVNPGGILDAIISDPVAEVIAALEEGDYTVALDLVEDIEVGGAVQLRLREGLEARLNTLVSDFKDENIELAVINMELNTIDRMGLPGLSTQIVSTRETISRLNDSRTAFNTAESLRGSGNYAAAIAQYMLVIYDDPNYGRALEGVRMATDAHRNQALTLAGNYSGNQNYDRAIIILSEALLTIENDPQITQQLNIYRVSMENANRQRVLDTASDHAADGNWAVAISVLTTALRDMPGDSLITERLRSYEQSFVDAAVADADGLASESRYNDAISMLNTVLQSVPNDARIVDSISRVGNLFVDAAIANADVLAAEGNHDDAISLLNTALQTIPNDGRLMDSINRIDGLRPLSLSTLVVVDSANYYRSISLFTDSFGNHYHESFRFYANTREGYHDRARGYAVYNLGGEFRTFTAYVVAPAGLASYAEFLIEITFDEIPTPVTFVEGFNVRTGARRISADVSGATTMTITVRGRGAGWNNRYHSVRLVNAELQR